MATPKTRSSKPLTKPAEKPWTISGISQKTRNAAAKAARAEGIPIDRWVDKTLYEATRTEKGSKTSHTDLAHELRNAVDGLSGRVDRFLKRTAPSDESVQHVRRSLEELGAHVGAAAERAIDAASPAAEKVSTAVEHAFEEIVDRLGLAKHKVPAKKQRQTKIKPASATKRSKAK